MKKLVAIGGGELKDLETLPLDKEIVKLTGKRHPKALFIPTASEEPEGYIETFHKIYGEKLGCKTDTLLLKEKPSRKEIGKKILASDLVYVGGGNTLRMMRAWRRSGVGSALKQAYRNGIVLSGISAGAICWFSYGHSDSMSFYSPKKWNYIKVKGLGLIDAIFCPHFNGKGRRKRFVDFVGKNTKVGIAVDNCCGLEFAGEKYRVFSSRANAYKIYRSNGRVVIERLEKKDYAPIATLLEK